MPDPAPRYRLEYFNLRGRAEPIRWVLAAAGVPYEDFRLDRETEWPQRKPDTRYGKLPVLHVDGRPLSQSEAICRYLGGRHGLLEADPWGAAVGDEVVGAVHDLVPPAGQIQYAKLAKDRERAKRLSTEFYSSTLPPTLRVLEARLGNTRFFCGETMTWVDIFCACYLSQLLSHDEDSVRNFPRVKKLVDHVTSLPSIVAWLEKRPNTVL